MHQQSQPPILPGSSQQQAPPAAVWVRPLTTLFVVGTLLGVSLYFFPAVSTVVLGALAAAIVACTLNPLLRYIPGPRGAAAAVLGLTFMGVVGSLVYILYVPLSKPIGAAIRAWPTHKVRVDYQLARWSDAMGLSDRMSVDALVAYASDFFASEGGRGVLSQGADVAFSVLIWLAFIFIGSIFMLADPEDALLGPAVKMVAPAYRPRVVAMLEALGMRLRRWVLGTLMSMAIVFTASYFGYSFVGLGEVALPIAMIAGLAEIVPTVGPSAAALVALLFAATQGGGVVVGVLIVWLIVQTIEAYVLLPMIMRGAVKVHPAVTLFTVVLWGKLFGVPGLMLAIPINLTIGSAIEFLYVRPRDEGKSL